MSQERPNPNCLMLTWRLPRVGHAVTLEVHGGLCLTPMATSIAFAEPEGVADFLEGLVEEAIVALVELRELEQGSLANVEPRTDGEGRSIGVDDQEERVESLQEALAAARTELAQRREIARGSCRRLYRHKADLLRRPVAARTDPATPEYLEALSSHARSIAEASCARERVTHLERELLQIARSQAEADGDSSPADDGSRSNTG